MLLLALDRVRNADAQAANRAKSRAENYAATMWHNGG